ncbi:MAG: S-adenosylmethionine decarboxylase [Candidatus Poseidonia sp.]|nr:S-adenosylmethionine decarboxylase [Poseidonia sp.]
MTSIQSAGSHVFMDYTGAFFTDEASHTQVLELMRAAVERSPATEVHAKAVPFDGSTSPPGFAAVVLIDESHLTAHCYADRGLLAVDCFTCGQTDPDTVADDLHAALLEVMPELVLVKRERIERFTTGA